MNSERGCQTEYRYLGLRLGCAFPVSASEQAKAVDPWQGLTWDPHLFWDIQKQMLHSRTSEITINTELHCCYMA